MSKQLVFIDDSGDPGFKGATSPNFIMAAAVFMDSRTATLINEAISKYRRSLGWQTQHEFKFSKAPKEIKLQFLKIVNKYNFEIYAVYMRKIDYPNLLKFSDNEKLYNWATKELLSIIPLDRAIIKIDGKYSKKYKIRIKTYIRQELNRSSKKIKDFDVQNSVNDNLIQLTDIVAGAINRSLQEDKTDSKDYIGIIEKKIVKIKPLNLSGR